MNKKALAATLLISAAAACCAEAYRETLHFKCKKLLFRSEKIPADTNFTILQISDLHNHRFGRNNQQLISAIQSANADILVLTGDMIDKKTSTLDSIFTFIEKITSWHPHVYFVSGNHEWDNGRTYEFFNGLRKRNVTILDNQNTRLDKNGVMFNIAGVADPSTARDDVEQAFQHMTNETYTILLSHSPCIIDTEPSIPADLILSGHTHGGQVRFPFIGALIAPGQGLFPKLAKGTYTIGSNQHLYVDSGVGTTRLPIRFLNPSQLSLITITGTET